MKTAIQFRVHWPEYLLQSVLHRLLLAFALDERIPIEPKILILVAVEFHKLTPKSMLNVFWLSFYSSSRFTDQGIYTRLLRYSRTAKETMDPQETGGTCILQIFSTLKTSSHKAIKKWASIQVGFQRLEIGLGISSRLCCRAAARKIPSTWSVARISNLEQKDATIHSEHE